MRRGHTWGGAGTRGRGRASLDWGNLSISGAKRTLYLGPPERATAAECTEG